jgi:hypothetical protein
VHIRENILARYLTDNTNAWQMRADGSYVRRTPSGKPFNVQESLIELPSTKLLFPSEVEA